MENALEELLAFRDCARVATVSWTRGRDRNNKPGQNGSDRVCLRNAFVTGVSAWRIGNQFALANFVLIPIRPSIIGE